MKFLHMGDCHLGGWRQPELKELNFKSFQYALKEAEKQKVDFILISGDLFDTAYPPIETLKDTFEEFKKIRELNIKVFLIAGSHDYSVSGKTFLDVLEKAGFCKNVVSFEEKNNKIILQPTIYRNVAIYGFPGKKSGLEVDEVEKISLQDSPGMFRILMLHTTLRDAIKDLPIKSVDETKLPKVDYTALSHLHINYIKDGRVYSGPTFPNNLSELEELQGGSFFIFDNGNIKKHRIKLKEIVSVHLEITTTIGLTEEIINLFKQKDVKGKIVILRLSGILEKGKLSDVDFQEIEKFLKDKGSFVFLRGISKLHIAEPELGIDVTDTEDIEGKMIAKFIEKNPSEFNKMIPDLMNSLKIEKLEDETTLTFEERLLSESKKLLKYEVQKNKN